MSIRNSSSFKCWKTYHGGRLGFLPAISKNWESRSRSPLPSSAPLPFSRASVRSAINFPTIPRIENPVVLRKMAVNEFLYQISSNQGICVTYHCEPCVHLVLQRGSTHRCSRLHVGPDSAQHIIDILTLLEKTIAFWERQSAHNIKGKELQPVC